MSEKQPGPRKGLQCPLHTHSHTQPELPLPLQAWDLFFRGEVWPAGVSDDDQDLGQPFEEATRPSHGQQVPNQSPRRERKQKNVKSDLSKREKKALQWQRWWVSTGRRGWQSHSHPFGMLGGGGRLFLAGKVLSESPRTRAASG